MKNAQLGCLAMMVSVGGLIVVLAVKSPTFAILAGLVFVVIAAVSLIKLLKSTPFLGLFLGVLFFFTSILLFAASWTISYDKKEAVERAFQEKRAKAEQAAREQRHEEIRASADEIFEESKALFDSKEYDAALEKLDLLAEAGAEVDGTAEFRDQVVSKAAEARAIAEAKAAEARAIAEAKAAEEAKAAAEARAAEEEADLLAQAKPLPASESAKLRDIYRRLSVLRPENKTYDARYQKYSRAEEKKARLARSDLVLIKWSWGSASQMHVKAEGQVKNVSGRRLENVAVAVTWKTSSGEFITSDSALIDYNPIMPGQVSTFSVITTKNPAMSKASIDFKYLFGASIPWVDRGQ